MPDLLSSYRNKRNFAATPEPLGKAATQGDALTFVIQKHAARSLHYDFRLELDGTLKSWAVPKGPSLDPAQKRMAVQVEDHPLAYGSFEGVIPPKQYGAGTVVVWDRGLWQPVGDPGEGYRNGKLKFRLDGEKLHGMWMLVAMHGRGNERQPPWLLIKERDEFARPAADYSVVDALPDSVLSAGSDVAAIPSATATATATATPTPSSETTGATGTAMTNKRTTPTDARTATKPAKPSASRSTRATKPGGTTKGAPKATSAEPDLPAGAVPAALPKTLAPELATLVAAAPSGDDWSFEVKFDGYRIVARIEAGEVRLLTRNGNDWTAKLGGIARELGTLGIDSAWLDGEIVVLDEHGASDFGALQNAFDGGGAQIVYYVFDLPYFAGHDLRAATLEARRALLEGIVGDGAGKVRFSQDFHAAADDILRNACRLRLEGVIGKRLGSRYVSRRSPDWIKLKCTLRQEFVIGGYTEPKGSRTGVGALLLGIHDEQGKLRFAGSVGTGFDTKTLATLRRELGVIETSSPPFFEKPREAKGTWVEPKLVAEVSFAEWTRDGKIRHSVFHGLRNDKPATGIGREVAVPAPRASAAGSRTEPPAKPAAPGPISRSSKRGQAAAASGGAAAPIASLPPSVHLTNPQRVIDPSSQATKRDLVDYYVHAAKRMLPHLAKRPVAIVRAPAGLGGQHFFQKHSGSLKIEDLRELPQALDPGHPPLIEIDSFIALVSAAQMNVVEFHTWNASSRAIEKPDRMTFDLDPGEGVAWARIVEAALLTKTVLDELGLRAFVKTSGGKGLHVVVPLAPRDGWDAVKDFSQDVVERLALQAPDLVVAKSGPKNRVGRIFVDYLRNGRGATTAAAFSARARPGLGVSVPCAWNELGDLDGGDHWTIASAHERLESAEDPWADYGSLRQTLAAARRVLANQAPPRVDATAKPDSSRKTAPARTHGAAAKRAA